MLKTEDLLNSFYRKMASSRAQKIITLLRRPEDCVDEVSVIDLVDLVSYVTTYRTTLVILLFSDKYSAKRTKEER